LRVQIHAVILLASALERNANSESPHKVGLFNSDGCVSFRQPKQMSRKEHQASAKTAWKEKFNFPRWMPVAASVALLAVVAFVAAGSMKNLKDAIFWRQHTFQTILAAHLYEDNLTDIQSSMFGFVTMGDTNALASCQNYIKLEPQFFSRLVDLTRENPGQQQRLKNLGEAMKDVFVHDARLIDTYKQQGAEAVLRMEQNGESGIITVRALDILKAFSGEEQKLMDARDASEQREYHHAGQLLVTGSVLAAVLLLLANFMAGRELTFRRRAEARLNRTLLLQKAILNSSDYGIVSTGATGIVKTFNPAAEKLLGYSASEIIGKATPMLWRDPKEIAEHAHQLSHRLGLPVRPTFEYVALKVKFDQIDESEWTFIRKDGSRFTSLLVVTALSDEAGNSSGFLSVFRDISQRRQSEIEREKLVAELQEALTQVKMLSGLIPICAWCKNIRNDKGYWQNVEEYVRSHSEATFTHGICPDCTKKFGAEIAKANNTPETSRP
jgi:PAS domain S-box-containing protein